MISVAVLLPYLVLISHIILTVFFISLIFKNNLSRWIGRNAILLSFLVALVAVGGSLFYSNIIGYEPCVLCWWIRIFLYPLVIIFGMALWKHDKFVFTYAVPLTLFATFISLYFSYVSLGGASILPCTAYEGACSCVYVKAFGYITIPTMSLTVSLFILLFAYASKLVNRTPNA